MFGIGTRLRWLKGKTLFYRYIKKKNYDGSFKTISKYSSNLKTGVYLDNLNKIFKSARPWMPSKRRLSDFIEFINMLTLQKEFNLAFNLGYGLAESFPKVSDAQLIFTQLCLNRRILFLAEKYAFLAHDLQKDDFRILNCCGIVFMHKNDINSAKEFFLKAIESRPDLPQSYLNLSQAYMFSNDFDNCERSLEQAISLDPHYMQALIVFAQFVLIVRNDRERFFKLLKEIKNIDPHEKAIPFLLYQESQRGGAQGGKYLDEWLQKCMDESFFPF